MIERGGYEELSGSWSGTGAAATALGRIYAVHNGSLYMVSPETGEYRQLDGSWSTRHMVGLGDHLYMFEDGGALDRNTAM